MLFISIRFALLNYILQWTSSCSYKQIFYCCNMFNLLLYCHLKQVELSHPNAEIRLLEVFYHKIYKVMTVNSLLKFDSYRHITIFIFQISSTDDTILPGPHVSVVEYVQWHSLHVCCWEYMCCQYLKFLPSKIQILNFLEFC